MKKKYQYLQIPISNPNIFGHSPTDFLRTMSQGEKDPMKKKLNNFEVCCPISSAIPQQTCIRGPHHQHHLRKTLFGLRGKDAIRRSCSLGIQLTTFHRRHCKTGRQAPSEVMVCHPDPHARMSILFRHAAYYCRKNPRRLISSSSILFMIVLLTGVLSIVALGFRLPENNVSR